MLIFLFGFSFGSGARLCSPADVLIRPSGVSYGDCIFLPDAYRSQTAELI
jgi:hypothetical protein